MKIYTRKGDQGNTYLLGGKQVPKHHLRIESYGTVDELNSWIGLVADLVKDNEDRARLRRIQDRLFVVGSLLAKNPLSASIKTPQIDEHDVTWLEQCIDEYSNALPALTTFVLPGGNLANSSAHIARCVCRRAERQVSRLASDESVDPVIIKFLNRLSDFLFMLARKASKDFCSEEIPWRP